MRNFVPTTEWREVQPDEVLPPGCEIRMSPATGRSEARAIPPRIVARKRAPWWKRLLKNIGEMFA